MGKIARYFDPTPERRRPREVSPRPPVTSPLKNVEKDSLTSPPASKVAIKTIIASSRIIKPKFSHKNKKNFKGKGKKPKSDDPFPGKAPLDKNAKRKFSRGSGLSETSKKFIKTDIRSRVKREKIFRHDEKVRAGIEQAARSEILLTEESGRVEVDEGEHTLMLRQYELKKHVDLASATKSFNLTLDQFGPYTLDYTLNGRYLCIGGRKGHLAAFEWTTKKLLCEMSVRESVHDVKWLHNEMMFAVAQKEWTYIYDNQGIEVHCLKKLDRVMKLDFLPYHFLLVGGHQSGFLSWVDVSIGKIVAQFGTRGGPLGVLTTNPANAVTHCGHGNGTVTLWSPSVKKSLASILCHGAAISSIAVDSTGRLMATSGMEGHMRIWDLRNSFTPLSSVKIGVASDMCFSQKGLLSIAAANQALIYSEVGPKQKPYMKHVSSSKISSVQFCPFEDILGLGTHRGFESLIIPGAGEANYDALERNPFQTKKQRREAEVKALLEKIQPELICLDNSLLGEVDTEFVSKSMEEKPKYVKKADIQLTHRKKRKNAKLPKIKEGLRSELTMKNLREEQQREKSEKTTEEVEDDIATHVMKTSNIDEPFDALTRFKSKKKK